MLVYWLYTSMFIGSMGAVGHAFHKFLAFSVTWIHFPPGWILSTESTTVANNLHHFSQVKAHHVEALALKELGNLTRSLLLGLFSQISHSTSPQEVGVRFVKPRLELRRKNLKCWFLLYSPTLFNNATIVDTKAFSPLDLQPAFQVFLFAFRSVATKPLYRLIHRTAVFRSSKSPWWCGLCDSLTQFPSPLWPVPFAAGACIRNW